VACPYRGLSAFREEDHEVFFGRDGFICDLVDTVISHSFVAIIGASGSGKSSVVLAGLIPKLRSLDNWITISCRPGKQPFYFLASALTALYPDKDGHVRSSDFTSNLSHRIRHNKNILWQEIANILEQNQKTRILLIVDQFEEIYTLAQDEQEFFIDSLIEATQNNPRFKVAFTIRTDFLDHVINKPSFKQIALKEGSHKFIGDMTEGELRSIIEPIDRKTQSKLVFLEEGLTDRILDDIQQEPGKLPLLEFALTQLWQSAKGKRRRLTLRQYEQIGGVRKALANHADEIYNNLCSEEKNRMQQIFLKLVRPGEKYHTGQRENSLDIEKNGFFVKDHRQSATRAELGEENWQLAISLSGADRDSPESEKKIPLLVSNRNEETGEQTVEIVHEALIREWVQLLNWLNKSREQLVKIREIELLAKRWQASKKKSGYLQGRALRNAKDFHKQLQDELSNVSFSSLTLEFLRASTQNSFRQIFLYAIVPISVISVTSYYIYRNLEIRQLWETLDNSSKSNDSSARNTALERLVQLGESLENRSFVENDLTGVNLSGANLTGTNFEGAVLKKANLSKSDLSGSFLGESNLNGANLDFANLNQADFTNSYLYEASMQGANLAEVNFTGADLAKSKLDRSSFRGVNFLEANLRNASMTNITMVNSNFSSANLGAVDFDGSQLENVIFKNAYLGNTKTKGQDLSLALNAEWTSLEVDSRKSWVTTKVCPKIGDVIEIIARGKWSNGYYMRANKTMFYPFSNADGRETVDLKKDRKLWVSPSSNLATLIGRSGNNDNFRVGGYYRKEVQKVGCFSFSINDDILQDNMGVLTLLIKIQPKSQKTN
jgi:uncharacterized protein YjbI with pentapeptide repeats/ABC-type dipeptide/oligopeptide/nickel transport system ATPase component